MATPYTVAASSLFRGLTVEQCEPFAPLAREQVAPKGADLFRLGEPAAMLLVVRRGTVSLTMPLSLKGRDGEVVVQEARAGETIAWSALIAPYRFTMSGKAETEVHLLAFPRHELQLALAAHPDAGLRILTNLAHVIGRRLQIVQAMWSRELQRAVNMTFG